MIEFGSDYHLCGEDYMELNASYNFWQDKRLYACGRHAFGALIQHNDWKRIWVPAYFCYEVVEYIETLHIEVKLYNDFPGNKNVISNIKLNGIKYQELTNWQQICDAPSSEPPAHRHPLYP